MPKSPPVHEQLPFLTVVTVQLHGGLLMVLLHWLSVRPAIIPLQWTVFKNQGNVIKYVRVGGISGEGYFNNIAEFYQHSTTNLIISFQQQLDSLSWFPGWLLYPVFTQPNIQIQIAVNVISISSTEQEKLLCPNFRFTLWEISWFASHVGQQGGSPTQHRVLSCENTGNIITTWSSYRSRQP